jgi:hypothetical protein
MRRESANQNVQHARHLREDQHAVAARAPLAEELLEDLQLATVVLHGKNKG